MGVVSCESFFFEAGVDPIVVDTPLGRIALVICAEALATMLLAEVAAAAPDRVLIGFSSPGASKRAARLLGGPPDDLLRRIARRWARCRAAPVVVACVTGRWRSGLPGLPFVCLDRPFYGRSGIYAADGTTLAVMDASSVLGRHVYRRWRRRGLPV